MSEYTTAVARPIRVTFAQRVLAGSLTAAAVRERYPELTSLPGAIELRAAADELRKCASLPPARQAERLGAVLATPGITEVASTVGRVDLVHSSAPTLAGALAAIDAAAREVAGYDRRVLVDAMVETLRDDLKFHVTIAEGSDTTRIRAVQANRVVLVDAQNFGRLRWDIAGCEGGSCRPTQRQIIAGLRQRGVDVQILDRDHHQDPRGGAMLRDSTSRKAQSQRSRQEPTPGRVAQ